MDYAKAVAEGRRLLARSNEDQWALAELTYLVTVTVGHTLKEWAHDLGSSETHVARLRNLWARWGANGRVERSSRTFAEYYMLADASEERAERLERNARRHGRSVTSEERSSRPGDRMRAVREVLNDPEQRDEILADASIRKLLARRLAEWNSKPKPPKPRRKDGYAGELEEIRERLTRLLDEMIDRDLDDDERAALLPVVEAISGIVEWMRSHVETADRSFEDALDALLAGELPPPPAEPALPAQKPKPVRVRKPKPSMPATEEPVFEQEPAEEAAAAEPPKGRKSRDRPDKGRKAS